MDSARTKTHRRRAGGASEDKHSVREAHHGIFCAYSQKEQGESGQRHSLWPRTWLKSERKIFYVKARMRLVALAVKKVQDWRTLLTFDWYK